MTLWAHSTLGSLSLFSARCDVISETSSPTLFQEFIYLGNVSWARRRPPSLIYPLPLFPSTAGVCCDWALTGGHAACWGAGSVINLFSPNHIFPVSPGTGDSPITNLISKLCRRLVASYVSWIAFSIKLLINIFRPQCVCEMPESGMDGAVVSPVPHVYKDVVKFARLCLLIEQIRRHTKLINSRSVMVASLSVTTAGLMGVALYHCRDEVLNLGFRGGVRCLSGPDFREDKRRQQQAHFAALLQRWQAVQTGCAARWGGYWEDNTKK